MWKRQEAKLAVEQERKDEELAMGGPVPQQQSRDVEHDSLAISPIIDDSRPITEKGKETADTTTVEKQVKGGEIF